MIDTALDIDLSPHLGDDGLDVVKSQSGALARLFGREERFKNLLQHLGFHTAAGIRNPHVCTVEQSLCGEGQPPSALFHGLDRVGDEIDQDMKDLIGVASRSRSLLVVLAHSDVVKADRVPRDLQRLIKPVIQADDGLISGRGFSRVLGQIPADGAGPAHGVDDFARLFVDRVPVLLLRQVFRQSHDQLERVVDVVGQAGGKGPDPSQFFGVKEFRLQIGFVTHQFPEHSCSRTAQYLRLWTLMVLNESFDRGIAGDIHDQVDAMVVDEVFDLAGDGYAKVLRPHESRRLGIPV